MFKFHNVLLAGLLLVAGACSPKGPAALSGDSAYEMQMSIMKIAHSLPADRRDEFERAVETIMLSTTDRGLASSDNRLTTQAIALLKGRTVNQVIENAKLIRSASASL